MTLDTRIFITDPVDHRTVFNKVNDLLHIPTSRIEIEQPTDCSWRQRGDYEISNRLGQGFDAWVMSYSNADGSPVFIDRTPDEDGDVDERPNHYVEISMDTAYGYQGPNGEDCSMLHARVIFDLGTWLREQGIGWVWQNEYTGEYHEDFEGLEEFIGNGVQAQAWFTGTVLPAVARELER